MAQRKLSLIIEVIAKQQQQLSTLIAQFEKLKNSGEGLGFGDDGTVIAALTQKLKDAEVALESMRRKAQEVKTQGIADGLEEAADQAQAVNDALEEVAKAAKVAEQAAGGNGIAEGLETAQRAALELSDDLQDIKESLSDRRTALELDVTEAQRRLQQIALQREEISDQAIRLELNANRLNAQLAEVQDAKQALSEELIQLQSNPDAVEADLSKLRAQIARLDEDEIQIGLSIKSNNRSGQRLQNQITDLNDTEIRINADTREAQKRLLEFDGALDDLSQKAKAKKFTPDDLGRFSKTLGLTQEQLRRLPGASNKFFDGIKGGAATGVKGVSLLAAKFLLVKTAIQQAFAIAQSFYARTIGLTEQLNQQVLKNAANIATSARITANGVEQTGVDALLALKPKVLEITKEIDIATDQIAGVTEEQSRLAGDALIGKISQLQGQTKEYASALDSLPDLTSNLVAALSTQGLADPTQINQEIGDLAAGQIGPDSTLARALGITNDDINRAKQQGKLIDVLIERTQIYRDATNLAANSITNVTSNFSSLVERVSRAATADLLEPISTQLIGLFKLVQSNEGQIVDVIKTVLDSLFEVGKSVGEILSPLTELGDEGGYILDVLVDTVKVLEITIRALTPALKYVVSIAVDNLERLVGIIQTVDNTFNTLTGGIARMNNSIDQYGQSTAGAEQESLRLLKTLSGLREETYGLTEEEKKQDIARKQLAKSQAAELIKQNQDRIEELKELRTKARLPDQKQTIDNQIASLTGFNDKIAESVTQIKGLGSELDVLPRNFSELVDTYEETSERVRASSKNLADGSQGDLQRVSQNIKQLTEDLNTLFDAGKISEGEAIAELVKALEADGLDIKQRQQLSDEIRKIQKKGTDARVADIKNELTVLETSLTDEEKATAESIERISALRKRELDARIGANLEAIANEQALIAKGAGSDRTLKELQNERDTLQAEVLKFTRETEGQIRNAKLGERKQSIDAEIALVESAIAQEETATVEQITRLNQLRQDSLKAQIDAQAELVQTLRDNGASQTAIDQAVTQQKTLQAQLQAQAVKSQKEIEQARIAIIDQAQLDIKALSLESQRQIFLEEQALLQEKARNAELTEQQIQARISALSAENNRDRIAQEIALQEQRVLVYEEGTQRRRQAELELFELRGQLQEANAALERTIRDRQVAAISKQIEDEQRLQQRQQERLQLREQAENRVLQVVNQQRAAFESQLNLINSRNQLAQSLAGAETQDAERALAIRKELSSNDQLTKEQRRQLEKELSNLGFSRGASEKKIAQELLDRKKEEFELRVQNLEIQQQAERAQLQLQNTLTLLEAQRETRREQGRLRELEFQQKLLELQASRAEADGDARSAKIARESAADLDANIAQQQQAIAASQQAEQLTKKTTDDATRSLIARQAKDSLELTRNLAQESQQLANQLGEVDKGVGRQAQRLANKTDKTADAARVEANQVLKTLKSEELTTSTLITTELTSQLDVEERLRISTEQRLIAARQLKEVLETTNPQAQTETVPSLDTGGALPTNGPAMIHAGEMIVPGAGSKMAALNAIAGGQPAKSVKTDGLYQGSGYVLNRGEVASLLNPGFTPVDMPAIQPPDMTGVRADLQTLIRLAQEESLDISARRRFVQKSITALRTGKTGAAGRSTAGLRNLLG